MRIAVIGGGFTGLTAAYELGKAGHHVTVLERETVLGGLAHGFRGKGWEWPLEFAYHHIFTNDHAILNLVDELGFRDHLIITRPVTATYVNGRICQLDSPVSLLRFRELPIPDRLRTGFLLAAMKLNPFWQPLEHLTAQEVFLGIGGRKSWEILWQPLLYGKFHDFAPKVAASWLWARVKKRTPSLGYFAGGFQALVERLAAAVQTQGGVILTDTPVSRITVAPGGSGFQMAVDKDKTQKQQPEFDRVLLTVPTPIAAKLAPPIPASYFQLPSRIPHLHAQLLILETTEPILKNVYWLNINDRSFPFLAAVAHTNFMDKRHYAGHHITYFGNYLPEGHPYLEMTKERLLKEFLPFINRLSSRNSKFEIQNSYVFVGRYAQPVHQVDYSRKAPKLETGIRGLYLANLDSVYPWDRGTNYAVELGKTAAEMILSHS